jgi:hypothetical protein
VSSDTVSRVTVPLDIGAYGVIHTVRVGADSGNHVLKQQLGWFVEIMPRMVFYH